MEAAHYSTGAPPGKNDEAQLQLRRYEARRRERRKRAGAVWLAEIIS